jgi:hypothetical protein
MQVERVCHDTLPWLISISLDLCSAACRFDSDKLIERGKELFEELLAAARDCRSPRNVPAADLTSFESIQRGLLAFESPNE